MFEKIKTEVEKVLMEQVQISTKWRSDMQSLAKIAEMIGV